MNKKGAFIFVLHSHIPYVRMKGKWPHGEEMLFEVIAETYIPLLNALNELLKEGVKPQLTISLTPILLEQLNDKYMREEFVVYLKRRINACRKDIRLYSSRKIIEDKKEALAHKNLAKFYLDFYSNVLISFERKYKKNIIKGFKELQDKGVLDIITSSATHAYLPLFYSEESINEQIKVGIETYKKYFDRNPRGIWLPECGYRPLLKTNGKRYDGFEKVLEEFNIQYFFTDAHVFSSNEFSNIKNNLIIGPYKYRVIKNNKNNVVDEKPTFFPYTVASSSVSVFARDIDTSLQVWSSAFGYPGDYFYREFHSKDAISGLNYCRITNHNDALVGKEIYEPDIAKQKVKEHADHFSSLVENKIKDVYKETGEYSSIVSSYDTELFGHWWFEGVDWLKQVLRNLSKSTTVDLAAADKYIKKNPPNESINMPESSWGLGGAHEVWFNDETEWIWPIIHELSDKIKNLKKDFPKARGVKKNLLNQALRELLLLHSSDWPFLISTYQAKEYATERFNQHKDRCKELLELAYSKNKYSKKEIKHIKDIMNSDNPFQDLDYKQFGVKIEGINS